MADIAIRRCRQVDTTSPDGTPDGRWVRLLAEAWGQVDLQVVAPLTMAGWYIHAERDEWHICIQGQALIALAGQGAVATSAAQPRAIEVPALTPHAIYNAGETEAWVIVISSQPHDEGDDKWPMAVRDAELATLGALWEHEYGA